MKRHLLLIDDDDDEFDLLTTIVGEIPLLECSYANSGLKGIALIETTKPDLVLLDMNMPVMNGLECLKKIFKNNELQDTRIYMYSNSNAEDLKQQALQFGATGCLTKPSTLDSLRSILHKLLNDTFPGFV